MLRGAISRAMVIVPAAALALAASATAVQAAGSPSWQVFATVPHPSVKTFLYSVATDQAGHGWAVGDYTSAPPKPQQLPVIDDWNGSAWAPMTLPAGFMPTDEPDFLVSVSASGPHNVWVYTGPGHWLHFDGSTWTKGKVPGGLGSTPLWLLTSLTTSPTTGWAFGGTGTGPVLKPYAAFRSGSVWKRTSVPGTGAIAGASAVSGHDIWAVLGTGQSNTGITSPTSGLVHWSGGAWHAVAGLPAALRNFGLGSVYARSDSNVWVGGAVKNSKSGLTEAIGHWNGHAWTVTTLAVPATTAQFHIASIVSDGAGGLWALGLCMAKCGVHPSRLWQDKGGHWAGPTVPSWEIKDTAVQQLAGSGHSVWGVGRIADGGVYDGLFALWGPVP